MVKSWHWRGAVIHGWLARAGKIAAAYVVFGLVALSALAGVSLFTPLLRGDVVSLEVAVPGAIREGWGQVWITYPGGHAYASVPLDGRDRAVKFTFNMSDVKARASRVLANLSKMGIIEYAALYFTAYLVRDDGSICIATYKYSTLDYYRDKTGSHSRALQLARQNPLALLEAGRLVVKMEKMSDCTPVNIPLDKAANGLSPTGIRIQPSEIQPLTAKLTSQEALPRGDGVDSINPPPPAQPPCPLSFAEIYFPGLYNQRYNPPQLWLDRVLLDPSLYWREEDRQRVIGDLWKAFASKFSLAYFFPSYCTAQDAVISAGVYTGFPEGVHTMDHVIITLAYDTGYTQGVYGWADEYSEGTEILVYDKAPIARITMLYNGQQLPPKPEFEVNFNVVKTGDEIIGVTFMGKIVFGRTDQYLEMWWSSTYVSAVNGWYSIGFIYAPLNVRYDFDAVMVHYVADKVVVNGIEYWRVVPLYYFSPFYTLVYDYNYISSYYDNYANPNNTAMLNELQNAYIELTSIVNFPDPYMDWVRIYEGTIYPGTSSFTIDSSVTNSSVVYDLGWLITFLANVAASKVFKGFNSKFHEMSTLVKPLVGVAIVKHDSRIVRLDLIVEVSTTMPVVSATVDKLSPLPEYLSECYSQMNLYPLLYTYSVTVYGP